MTNPVRENLTWDTFGVAARDLARLVVDSGYRPDLLLSITRIGDVEVVSQMSQTLKVLPASAQAQIQGTSDQGRTAYALAVFLKEPESTFALTTATYVDVGRSVHAFYPRSLEYVSKLKTK